MDIFQDKMWHHRVHEHLGERLFYYLVRVQSFEVEHISKRVADMLTEQQMGSVRVFPLFGMYDFIVRAWLPLALERSFCEHLKIAMGSKAFYEFSVTHIDKRWYWLNDATNYGINREVLEALDADDIREAQSTDVSKLQVLEGASLVIQRATNGSPDIVFFTTLTLAQRDQQVLDRVVRQIRQHMALSDNQDFKYLSLYRGFGFSQLLIKAQVETSHYFRIGKLVMWLAETFIGAMTETYLVMSTSQTVGDQKIAEATFRETQGRDLYVFSIIPEVYDKEHASKRPRIERFLNEHGRGKLSGRHKKLIHEYIKGVLVGRTADITKCVSNFFIDVEAYLRDAVSAFVELRLDVKLHSIRSEAGVSKPSVDDFTLGDTLRVYQYVQKRNPVGSEELQQTWDPVVDIRNKIQHGRVKWQQKWEDTLAP